MSISTDRPERVYGQSTLVRSLRIQLRVIGALLMREIITRFGRKNLGFAWLFVEPMMFTLGIMGLWTAAGFGHGTHGIPIAAFAITGYAPVLLWRNCATRASMAIPPNLPLLYHRNVKVLDLVMTRILLELAGGTISFFVLVTVFATLEVIPWPEDLGTMALGWLTLAWFGTSLALVIGALTSFDDIVERFWHTAAYLLFPISGALFMVDWLPKAAQPYVLAIPMVHGVEMLREGYFGSLVNGIYDITYVGGVCLGLTLLGLLLMKDAGRRAEVR